MCRNIKPLFNFDPPATDEEINLASFQFVRKVSGFTKPSKINEEAFNKAILEVSKNVREMFNNMSTNSKPKNRDIEKEKAKKRFVKSRGV
ncbi:MAG: hypothetical protein HeimC3_45760 [Candidatus Heimdallarchaeota archaeon LC_3]|nr:MAG: hypothetical protein HeimC3_45760 [Candidatus Heimdallarchaeota archaeon LC_3]